MYIGVSLVDNKTIRALNKKHLGRDYATDVLSFNYLDSDEVRKVLASKSRKFLSLVTKSKPSLTSGEYLGDIVVSVEKAKGQAKSYGNTHEEEIADLVSHGVLHLLGVHHKGDEESVKPVAKVSKK